MKIDRLLSSIVVITSLIALITTHKFPLEAAIYPRSIMVLLIVFGGFLYCKPKLTDSVTWRSVVNSVRSGWQVIAVSALTVLFIVSIETVGFFVGLFIYLLVVPFVLGERSVRRLVPPTILITAIVYVVFITILRINIPVAFWLMT